jgi:hypothetical protein
LSSASDFLIEKEFKINLLENEERKLKSPKWLVPEIGNLYEVDGWIEGLILE